MKDEVSPGSRRRAGLVMAQKSLKRGGVSSMDSRSVAMMPALVHSNSSMSHRLNNIDPKLNMNIGQVIGKMVSSLDI